MWTHLPNMQITASVRSGWKVIWCNINVENYWEYQTQILLITEFRCQLHKRLRVHKTALNMNKILWYEIKQATLSAASSFQSSTIVSWNKNSLEKKVIETTLNEMLSALPIFRNCTKTFTKYHEILHLLDLIKQINVWKKQTLKLTSVSYQRTTVLPRVNLIFFK